MKAKFFRPKVTLVDALGVTRALLSRNIAQGVQVERFEKNFASMHNKAFGIAVNSGTSALHLALLAMGVGSGDKVLVPGVSFAATANAVALTGAKPVFVDISLDNFLLDLAQAQRLDLSDVRAVIPVDLFGLTFPREELVKFAASAGLETLVDASQSHYAARDEGLAAQEVNATFSFYATKNMTTGEGGMILTNDLDFRNRLRELRNQGMSKTYQYERIGVNNRLTDFQASLGLSQMGRLRKTTTHRAKIARVYERTLGQSPKIRIQHCEPGAQHSRHQFTILVENRDNLARSLEEIGVETRVYYPSALNKIKPYFEIDDLPNSNEFVRKCLSLPIGPQITEKKAYKIANFIVSHVNG